MTHSRHSLSHIAYYAFLLLLLMVVGTTSASAQLNVPPPVAGTPPTIEDSNPKTPFDTREDYFKRFPFAQSSFDHDNKEIHEWTTRVVEGPPEPSFFDNISSFVGNIGNSIGSLFGLGGGNAGTSSSQGQTEPILRSQHSVPETGASGPVHVTAYPFFIKFCNDNPYQGVCYWQAGEAFDRPRTDRDLELFENVLTTFGYPVSDTQFQLIQRENFQRLLELMYDPERYMWMGTNTSQMQAAAAANSLAGVSEQAFAQSVSFILDGHNGNDGLLNVANENAASNMALNSLYRPVSAAYDVVMRCYKEIYVPMAILFLLPGAIITQVKATVSRGFDLGDGNPFEGIIRSMVAIFLIPGTQVIVSYSIDVGNSMATTAEDWVDRGLIIDWQHELTYNVNPHENIANVIEPPNPDDGREVRRVVFEGQNGEGGDDSIVTGNPNNAAGGGGGGVVNSIISFFSTVLSWLAGDFASGVFGSGGEGLGANVPEADTTQEHQLALSQAMQFLFNGATFIGALTIIILTAAQVVLICYLFLLGPLSAAFFAWPQLGKKLFRNVFGNWLYAVIMVSLWRFFWVVGLVIMTQRLLYINNPGGVHLGTGDLQWEVAVFVCILALMIWTSMQPFSYDPKAAFEFVEQFMESADQAGKQLAEGGGGGGGQGGEGGQAQPQSSGNNQPSSGDGGGGADSRVESPAGDSGSDDLNPADNATQRITDGGGSETGAESSASGDADSRTESMESGSPQDANAPPTESGGGGSGESGSGEQTQAPPSAQADAMAAGGAMGMAASAGTGGGGENAEVEAAVASSGMEPKAMPLDSAPVDRSPGDGSSQTGNYNRDADASQANAAMGAPAQTSGDTGAGSQGEGSGGSQQMDLNIAQDTGDSGGSSDQAPPPNLGNIQPPPMTDSSDDE